MFPTGSCHQPSAFSFILWLRRSVLLLDEPSDEFPEGFVFLLCDLVNIPLNPRFRERPLEVVDELGAEISPAPDRVHWKSREPVLDGRRQDDRKIIGHGVVIATCHFYC